MSIVKINIENYKSIKKCCINMEELNIIIGENGCGKTNILSAIEYFYNNLIEKNDNDTNIFDRNNKFNNQIKIGITYSFKAFKKIYFNQINKGNETYRTYYTKIFNIFKGKDELYVELTKIKDMPISWNIKSLEDRQIIYNIFPFYFIKVRELNLTNWEDLWLKIGDLVKIEAETIEEIKTNIFNIINNDAENKYKLHNKFELLGRLLKNANIDVKKYKPKEFGASLAKTYFSGERFVFEEEELSYFSAGTNSFNYINMLIEITNAIKIRKIKFPAIIIDEPELGLHHKFIDMLTDKILDNCKKIQFILSTHSSRLVKNIFKDSNTSSNIINLKYKDKYTMCSKMNSFEETRQLTFMNDECANTYFSKMFIQVEGATELELFNNRYLKQLYPVLKNVDVIYGGADEVTARIISPERRNYKTKFLIVKDIDKVIRPRKEEKRILNKFEEQRGAFIYNDKEIFLYGKKRIEILQLRKRIKNILEKCKFHYKLPFYSCTDENYRDLIILIKQYLLNYNIFVAKTTVEGMLINNENCNIFWEFLKQKKENEHKDITDLEKFYLDLTNNERVNLLRLLVEGKTDYILNLGELDKIPKDKKDIINRNKLDKTRWVTEWLEYYFEYILKTYCYAEDDFKKTIAYEEELKRVRNIFYLHFKELTALINHIYKEYHS